MIFLPTLDEIEDEARDRLPYRGMRVGVDNSVGASTLDGLYRCWDYL